MEFTLDHPDLFPTKTEVGLYLAGAIVDRKNGPNEGPIDTQLVGFVEFKEDEETEEEVAVFDEKTALTFTGLAAKRSYCAAAEVGGEWRYVGFAINP